MYPPSAFGRYPAPPAGNSSGPSQSGPSSSAASGLQRYPVPGVAPAPVWTEDRPPLQTQGSMGSLSTSMFQVHLLEQFRMDPPIAVPSSLLPKDTASQGAAVDLSLETQLIEAATGRPHVQAFLEDAKPGSLVDPTLQKYVEMGFSTDQVALGLAYCQHANLKEGEVVDFANSYRELTSMGYNPLLAAGALLKSNNDLPAATETCLAISS